MMYLLPVWGKWLDDTPECFGVINTPDNMRKTLIHAISTGRKWAFDNAAFTGNFNLDKWIGCMNKMHEYRNSCMFVVCPDVVGDAEKTIESYNKHRDIIKNLGYRVAFACQDGQENYDIPSDCDAVFIGGTTQWKLSKMARDAILTARAHGKHVHVGRVNTLRRIAYFKAAGADSVDGTMIVYKPTQRLQQLIAWMHQGIMFGGQNEVY